MKELFRGIPKKLAIASVLGHILYSIFSGIFSKLVTSTVSVHLQNELLNFIFCLFLFILVWNIEEFIADMVEFMLHQHVECNTFKYYINELYKIKPSILKNNNTGYITGLIQKLISHQLNTYGTFIGGLCLDITYIIYCTIILSKKNLLLGCSLVFIYALCNIFRILITNCFVKKHSLELTTLEGCRNRDYIDVSQNINTVQKMGAMSYFDEKFDKTSIMVLNKTKTWAFWNEAGFMANKSTAFMFTPIALLIIYGLSKKGIIITSAELAFLTSVFIQMPHNVRNLAKGISHYDRFKATYNKLHSIVNEENKRKELFTGKFESADINNIAYSYKKEDKNLKIIIPQFHVDKGDFICIHGESGQGKTTLLHLLSQEIENDNTIIRGYENRNGKEQLISTKEKRMDCVFIAQDTEMFDMSLRDNLILGHNIPDETLIQYLEEVGMGEWLSQQPDGLDTCIGERGVHVSTGQRQRLNLIRGLLIQNKDVYLLDEPTSNVDIKTEKKIINLIKKVLKDKTIIIVTHREEIMKICNKFYIFRNGILQQENI